MDYVWEDKVTVWRRLTCWSLVHNLAYAISLEDSTEGTGRSGNWKANFLVSLSNRPANCMFKTIREVYCWEELNIWKKLFWFERGYAVSMGQFLHITRLDRAKWSLVWFWSCSFDHFFIRHLPQTKAAGKRFLESVNFMSSVQRSPNCI